MTCPDCLRLRRPVGMHICVPGLRSQPQIEKPAVNVQTSGPGNLTHFRLPEQWSVASIWNARARTP